MNATERALQHCLDGNDMRGIGPWPRYIVVHERLTQAEADEIRERWLAQYRGRPYDPDYLRERLGRLMLEYDSVSAQRWRWREFFRGLLIALVAGGVGILAARVVLSL